MRITGAAALLAVIAVLFGGCRSTAGDADRDRPTIVVAAFGSSYETGQKNLEDFDKALRAAYPENEITWGFTAGFIVKKLRKNGVETLFESHVPVRHISETLADLAAEGRRDIVVVNFMLMVGAEYREVMDQPTKGLNVKYVHPLLYYPENIQNAVSALESEFGGPGEATIVCAHGNEKHPEYNAELIQIDNYLRENYSNAYVAVMEGTPAFEPVRESIAASDVESVKYIAFMLTYGDHMSNDVMGEDADSMKSRIGLPGESSDGMASLPGIQNLFIQKIDTALKQF